MSQGGLRIISCRQTLCTDVDVLDCEKSPSTGVAFVGMVRYLCGIHCKGVYLSW